MGADLLVINKICSATPPSTPVTAAEQRLSEVIGRIKHITEAWREEIDAW
jgi:hypothetical protein